MSGPARYGAEGRAPRSGSAPGAPASGLSSQQLDEAVQELTRTGDDEGALPLILECLDRDPDHAGCLAALAILDARGDQVERMRPLVEHLVAIAPDAIDTLVLRAELATADGDVPGACDWWVRACDRSQPYACRQLHAACRGDAASPSL